VAGDPDRLRQVVDNLVANAVRYAPTGSPIEVVVAPGTDEVTVEVRDHGPGVEPAERERVFEPFYRSDFARARRDGGAGLGLAIVSAIVGAHGGEVGVRPTPGGGATFWFSVPSAPRRVVGTTTFAEVNGEI
jgi:two-component system OmpR family sensor kinase